MTPSTERGIAYAVALGMQFVCVGCDRADTRTAADSLDGAMCPFDIYWPPRDPQDNPQVSAKPLLRGILALDAKQTPRGHAEGIAKTDLQTIVHVAKSDPFLLHLGAENRPARGHVKVWLIYADFLGTRPPRTWPKQPEWAGGILAYFEIDWETLPGHGCRGIVHHKRPDEGTRFRWADWAGTARLSDNAQ